MKRALVVIGVVVLMLGMALLAAPYWLGMQTEAAFSDVIKNVATRNGMPPTQYFFDRGWTSSESKNEIVLPTAPVIIKATHHIEHGPFPLSRLLNGNGLPVLALVETTFHVSASPDAPAKFAKILDSLPPLKMQTVIDLSGDGSSRLSIDAATRDLGETSMRWDAGDGQIHFDREWKKIKVDFRLPLFSVTTASVALVVKDLRLMSDMYEGKAGYMFGRNSFSISHISMQPSMEIQNVTLTAIAQEKGDSVSVNISYNIKSLHIAKVKYGPGKLSLTIRNLDTKTLTRFEDELNSIYRRGLPKEQSQMMIAGKSLELAGKLSRFNPELEITRLSFVAPGGDLVGKAKFILQGKDLDLSANPMLLLTAVKGSAELSIPTSLAKAMVMPQIQRDISSLGKEGKLNNSDDSRISAETLSQIADEVYPKYLQESGFGRWFVKKDKNYRFSMSVDRGKIIINGVPL